ncbi:MAG: sensor histidine kinase, partial [Chloroflexota bacterium]
DNGPGIPHDKQPHIWDKFYRVKQKGHEKVLGSGMGLAIVKTVAERHDGRVWLESEPGDGASFFIALKLE